MWRGQTPDSYSRFVTGMRVQVDFSAPELFQGGDFRTNVHHNLDRNPENVCLKNRPGIRQIFAGKIGIRTTTQGIGNPTKA